MKKIMIATLLFFAAFAAKANTILFINGTGCSYPLSLRCFDATNTACSYYSIEILLPPGVTSVTSPTSPALTAIATTSWTPATPGTGFTFDDLKGGLPSNCFQFEVGDCNMSYFFTCSPACIPMGNSVIYSTSGGNVIINIL